MNRPERANSLDYLEGRAFNYAILFYIRYSQTALPVLCHLYHHPQVINTFDVIFRRDDSPVFH
jgi:hypothetical protein